MTIFSHCKEARLRIEHEGEAGYLSAAQYIADNLSKNRPVIREDQAVQELANFCKRLLAKNLKIECATLLWGDTVFNTGPQSVKRIWDALETHNLISFIGASGMGKTFTPIVWLALDFIEDPEYTTIKLVSKTGSSAEANARSNLAMLWANSVIPLPGTVTAKFIGLDPNQTKFGIQVVSVDQGEKAFGSLRGKCHPFPRAKPHPKFGTHSRSRVFLDEDNTIADGVWMEIKNVKSALDDKGSVKIIRSCNPMNKADASGQRNEPKGGWPSVDMETSKEWISVDEWHVTRLDGKDCENVITGDTKFPGLITKQGYRQNYGPNGELTPESYIFSRGWYPPEGVSGSIFSEAMILGSAGEFLFSGRATNIGFLDPALEGGDDAEMTFGRCGKALAWLPAGTSKPISFKNPMWGIQAEQKITLLKADNIKMARQAIEKCKLYQVKPEHFGIDKTGTCSGVHDYMKEYWGPIIGVGYAEKSEDIYIVKEDTQMMSEVCDRMCDQLWIQGSRLMQYGFVKFNKVLTTGRVFTELIGRQYAIINKKKKVESKSDYKSRGNKSPDAADSVLGLIYVGHRLSEIVPAMEPDKQAENPFVGNITEDTVEYLDM